MQEHLDIIQKKIGYQFKKEQLLILAFVHSSYYNEHKAELEQHNERLEFLGDTVLGVVVADFLYKKMPKAKEGVLSFHLSNIVNSDACEEYLIQLQLDTYILLGVGQKKRTGTAKKNITADVFEALIGAIYLDGGLDAVKKMILKNLKIIFEKKILHSVENFKTQLQDFTQKKYQAKPIYEILSKKGPSHEMVFQIGVFLKEKKIGEGSGFSKKQAEQKAAEDALKNLGIHE